MTEEPNALPNIPKGWVWTTIGEIAWVTKLAGFEYTKYFKYKDSGPVRVVRALNIGFGEFKADNFVYVDTSISDALPRSQLQGGELLIVYVGSIGKIAVLPKDGNRYHLGPNVGKIVMDKAVGNPKFFAFFLISLTGQQFVKTISKAVTQSSLSMRAIRSLPAPLAPIPEQNRIVAKIEELFTQLDAAVEMLTRTRIDLKRYRSSVLKEAFEGKLTEEWRKIHKDEIEPASVLLERIIEERKKKKKERFKELPPIDTADLGELPKGWIWTRLGDIIFLSRERFDPLVSGNERFVGLKSIARDTGKLLGYGKSSETRSTKTIFRKGDLLYGKLRPYLNKVWVADFDGVCSTDILVFLKHDFTDNRYLSKILLNNDFVKYATQHMTGVQHPRVSFQVLSKYILPLPSLPEQCTIVAEIERRFSVVDELEKAVEQTLSQSEQLRQSILKRAFEGRLVPQNPKDKPAKKLLQRIREKKQKSRSKGVRKKASNRGSSLKQLGLAHYVK